MAVAYALLIGIFFYRDVTPRLIWDALVDTGLMTGAVMLIIMASGTIQWILTAEQVPEDRREGAAGIAVDAERRGQGLGTAALALARLHAWEAGHPAWAQLLQSFEAAMALHQRLQAAGRAPPGD